MYEAFAEEIEKAATRGMTADQYKSVDDLLKFVKKPDVFGHRTRHADSVLEQGKVISALEALRLGRLKSFEAGSGTGTHKAIEKDDKLSETQLDQFQSALLRSNPDTTTARGIVEEAGAKYDDAMKELLGKKYSTIKAFLKKVKKPEEFREHHLSVSKLSPHIFVTKGGVLDEPEYGDVSILARSKHAKPSQFANMITHEYTIDPVRPMEPRSMSVKSGIVIAARTKVKQLKKKYPGYKYVAEEDIPEKDRKEVMLPTHSDDEIQKRVLPAMARGTLKMEPR